MAHKKGVKRKYYVHQIRDGYEIVCSSGDIEKVMSRCIYIGEFLTSKPPRLTRRFWKKAQDITVGRIVLYSVQELVTADRVAQMFLKS
jgi:hypothetical protein